MSQNETERKLNEVFAQGQRLIFWFDDSGEYAAEIDSLRLDARVLKLTGKNYLQAKVLLEQEAREQAFLVYAPFARPKDGDNPLADTVYYSRVFSTDRVTEAMTQMAIPEQLRQSLAAYPQFWRSKARMDKFMALELQPMTEDTIHIAILCALSGCRVVHFDEVTKRLLEGGKEKGQEILDSFEQQGALGSFWQYCERFYGYAETNPSFDGLAATLLLTYTAAQGADLPGRLSGYVTQRKNNVSVFLSNFMGNAATREAFDKMSNDFARRLNIHQALDGMDSETLLGLDAFAAVDEILLERLADKLLSEEADIQLGGLTPEVLANKRTGGVLHFAGNYKLAYQMLVAAKQLMDFTREDLSYSSAREMAQAYADRLCLADTAYRKFCWLYDQLPLNKAYERLSDLVERLYVNKWLDPFNRHFSDLLEETVRTSLGLPLQEKFAAQYIAPRVGKERTVVIISDAFRYEVGRELAENLNRDVKFDAKVEAMAAALPTITEIGKPSLLPHREFTISEDFTVRVDGKPATTMEQRQTILQERYPKSISLGLDGVLDMPKRELQEKCQGKEVVYVYHDQIDARGGSRTANEVFSACEDALQKLEKGIRKLTDSISSTYYLVTADHGFQYRRSQVEEHEKIDVRGLNALRADKRFRLTARAEQLPGTLFFLYPQVGPEACISFPRNASVYKLQGGGTNFVHGGISPAELLVPLLTIRTRRGRQNVRKAELALLSTQRRIGNLITQPIEFIQSDPISDTVKAAQYKVFFESEDGQVVSTIEQISANSASSDAAARIFRKSFTLQNRSYSSRDRYYLVIQDAEDGIAQSQRHEFTIDIAFAGNFGFRV